MSDEQIKELANRIGTAVALFTMEYNRIRQNGGYLDFGVDSVIEPILREALQEK